MGTRIKEIDQYISRAAGFAQPILHHLRDLVHDCCPEVEEKIKWGFPHFDYKGEMMCNMAAFKKHCSFGFWKASLMKDPALMEMARSEVAHGHLGKITALADIPADKKLRAWIRDAMQLNEQGIKITAKPKVKIQQELELPAGLVAALRKNKSAKGYFDALSYSHRKEYIQWIGEAKTDTTREKRITQAIEMLSENKTRNWKYQKK